MKIVIPAFRSLGADYFFVFDSAGVRVIFPRGNPRLWAGEHD